jgi:hypothetical protein
MAHAGLTKTLPRFLLPRISWQNSTVHPNTIRTLTTSSSFPTRQKHRSSNDAPRSSGTLGSRTSILQKSVQHRVFHATARQARDHHFDTLKFVQRLREEGFTEAQAVAMMKVLSDVIEERFVLLCRIREIVF